MGLLGVWNSTFLGYSSRALLPYSQALLRFAAHIQQVDMESNGKRVHLDGTVLPFEAGEVSAGVLIKYFNCLALLIVSCMSGELWGTWYEWPTLFLSTNPPRTHSTL